MKRVTLELGGNDPAIVLPDVDPAAVGATLFWNAFYNTGQICMAVKRVYAHDDIYAPLCEALWPPHARRGSAIRSTRRPSWVRSAPPRSSPA
jgi:acyl-CoA reductase-like NAD-dependent aldehyde dehydrogenase